MRIILEHTKFKPLKARTYLSAAIRHFDKTYYNHVAIIINIDGIDYVFEAWKRVMLTPLEHWKRPGNIYKEIEVEADEDFARQKALSMCGWVEYNYLGTMLWQLIYQKTGKWYGPTGDRANKKVQCAQFAFICINRPNAWLASPRLFIEEKF
jgi:hypothetical protein